MHHIFAWFSPCGLAAGSQARPEFAMHPVQHSAALFSSKVNRAHNGPGGLAMRIALAFSLLLLLPAASAVCAQGAEPAAQRYDPARLSRASEVPHPANAIASGIVLLEARVSDAGQVLDVRALRGIPSLTEPAARAVRGWTFEPARMNGRAVEAVVPVAVGFTVPLGCTFRSSPPRSPGAKSPAPAGPSVGVAPRVEPPRIERTAEPEYPPTTAAFGSVVLEVRVEKSGFATEPRSVREIAGLSAAARSALRKWSFAPARLEGRPVESAVVAVFTFSNPPWCWPAAPDGGAASGPQPAGNHGK
jgi:hypothetical protein